MAPLKLTILARPLSSTGRSRTHLIGNTAFLSRLTGPCILARIGISVHVEKNRRWGLTSPASHHLRKQSKAAVVVALKEDQAWGGGFQREMRYSDASSTGRVLARPCRKGWFFVAKSNGAHILFSGMQATVVHIDQ